MVFTSRNWFAKQGPVAIILISWNVIFIWETGYWTRAIKRFALFDLLKSLYSDTKTLSKIYSVSAETIISDAFSVHFHILKIYKDKEVKKNVKNIFLSMCDVKMFLTLFHWIWYCFDNYFTYFVPVFKYCYSDSRNLWTVMRAGGLEFWLSLCKIVRSSVILLLPLFDKFSWWSCQ
jgi:hypothetical protein